jgi:hypothetical protein
LPELSAKSGRARPILAQESREGAAIRSVRVGWVLRMQVSVKARALDVLRIHLMPGEAMQAITFKIN